MNVLTVAKYLRLSSEDDDMKTVGKLESNSIANQRNLLDSYISRAPDFAGAEIVEFCDDGWSGKNFDRPGVQKLLDSVRSGEIGCIIVKDLSRKVKSAKMMRARRGLFLSPFAPYGYIKDPDNRNHLLIDPEAAETVRTIFRMMGEGTTAEQIARHLNYCAVPTPMQYKHSMGCSRAWPSVRDDNLWTRHAVVRILRDQRYIGNSVYGKRTSDRVGHYHSVKVSREDWAVVEDTHEGIVTQDAFDRSQNSMRELREREWNGSVKDHILKRKVRCGVCGHIMARSKAKNAAYLCETPRVTDAWSCSLEPVLESDILELVTEGLRIQAETAVEMSQIWEELHRRKKKDRNALRKAMTALQAEQTRQEREISSLYESLIMGEISTEKYLADKAVLTQAKEKTAERIASLEAEMNNMNQDGGLDNQFIEAFKKYSDVEWLSGEMVSEVLDSVLVYPDNRIEIVWKFQDEFEKLAMELNAGSAQ